MICKYCAHRRTCEISLHDDDYCADYRTSCPLPRVGSKEWGWTKSNVCVWSSPKTDLTVVGDGVYSDCCVRNKNRDLIADYIERLSTAKRIAELLTRLDWKREHGGKR